MTEIGSAIGYGMQKFHEAVDALIWHGSVQERLQRAGISLSMLTPEHHLPARLRSKFSKLVEEVNRARSLNDDDAAALASRVLTMAREVDKEYWLWEESV
jgi:hypothetical protein